jgi:uncharacterized membrane protein
MSGVTTTYLLAFLIGIVAGAFSGAALGSDRPAAIIEEVVALRGALLIARSFR